MRRPVMETTMEKLARIYANKREIEAVPGNGFATDGQKIWYVPMPDSTEPYLMAKTRHGFFHEKDHCVFTDFTDLKAGRISGSLHSIFNALEDTRIERAGAQEWIGQTGIAHEFLSEFVKRELNARFADQSVPIFKKILDLLYMRVREQELGDLGLEVPDKVQRLFDEKLKGLFNRICKCDDQKKMLKLAKMLHRRLKDAEPPKPPEQKDDSKEDKNDSQEDASSGRAEEGEPQGGESSETDNEADDSDSQESSSGDQSQDQESGDGEGQEGSGVGRGDAGEDSEDEPSDGRGAGSDEKDQDQSSTDDGGDDTEQSDQRGSDDQEGSGQDSDSSGSVGDQSEANDGDQSGSDCGAPRDDLQDDRDELAEQVKGNQQESTVNEDVASDVEQEADAQCIYRDANGLQEDIQRYNGNESVVRLYEELGRRMIGRCSSKLKRLFISMKAPKRTRMQRSGRLDLQRVWNDDTDVIFERRQPGIREHSAVSLVIDNSYSMLGQKAEIASALLSVLARELERLQIPFECMGFTTSQMSSGSTESSGVRTEPIRINLIKKFEEPYRKVRKHFQWPDTWCNGTVEFPCVRYAGNRLLRRDETKKILFILSDGESGGGHILMAEMQEYIQRLLRSGVKVVGFGIQNGAIAEYVPDTIVINDTSTLAGDFFTKLSKILLGG